MQEFVLPVQNVDSGDCLDGNGLESEEDVMVIKPDSAFEQILQKIQDKGGKQESVSELHAEMICASQYESYSWD